MSFVNEYISDEDRKKFDIDEIDGNFHVGKTRSPQWTIDRDRNIYLRCVARGREDIAHKSTWTFFWSGELLILKVELLATKGGVGDDAWSHKKINNFKLPERFKEKRDQIIDDLKEAFIAYKDGGVFSKTASYSLTLDIVEGE